MPEAIYLDHAATSWPKPAAVEEEVVRRLREVTANVGRSSHGADLRSARLLFDVRSRLARLFGAWEPARVVFTRGATEGLNLVLKGFLRQGDRAAVSPLEHNAVMRPLSRLVRERGIEVETLPADPLGRIDLEAAAKLDGRYRLAAVAHGSNVNGVVQDIRALAQAMPSTPLLLDAAQTAGVVPIDLAAASVAFMACSAHKGLLAPTGLGVLCLSPDHEVEPLMEGGTGSQSEATEQPIFPPDRYEAGTLPVHAIAGLRGALGHIEAHGLLGDRKRRLVTRLLDGLREAPGIRLIAPTDGTALLLSFTLEGLPPDRVARTLEREHGILCRPGLHCSPAAHRHLGTLPQGTVRLAPGFGNTEADIDAAVRAVHAVARQGG
ncbi:MAG: aminotransferase class V-fold PLP-dependent enzyme [Planctomycetota bacterium]